MTEKEKRIPTTLELIELIGKQAIEIEELQKRRDILTKFIVRVANWRQENWRDFLPECYKKEENWKALEVSARKILQNPDIKFEIL